MSLHRKRRYIPFILVCVALAASVLGVPRLSRLVNGRIEAGIVSAKALIEREYGFALSYQSISPAFIRSVKVNGLSATSLDGRQVLAVNRLTVDYDLLSLLRGSIKLNRIRLDDANLSLHPEDITRLQKALGSGGQGKQSSLSVAGIALKLKRVRLAYADGTNAYSFYLPEASAALRKNSFDFSLKTQVNTADFPSLSAAPEVVADLSAAGTSDWSFNKVSANLRLSASLYGLSVGPLRLALTKSGDFLQARKVDDRLPLDLRCALDLKSGELDAALAAQGLRLGSLASIRKKGLDPRLLGIRLSGQATLGGKALKPELRSTFSLKASVPDLSPVPALELSLSGSGNNLRFPHISLSAQTATFGLAYEGSLLVPEQSLDGQFRAEGTYKKLRIAGDFDVSTEKKVISFFSPVIQLGSQSLRNTFFDANLSSARPELNLISYLGGDSNYGESASSFSSEALSDAESSSISAQCFIQTGRKTNSVEGSLSLDKLNPAFFARLLADSDGKPEASDPLSQTLSQFRMNADAYFNSDFKHFSYSIPQALVSSLGKDSKLARISLSGNERSVKLQSLSVLWAGHRLETSGQADFMENKQTHFSLRASLDQSAYHVEGSSTALGGLQAVINGNSELSVERDRDEYQILVKLKNLPIPILSSTATLSLDSAGRLKSAADWDLFVSSLDLEVPALLGGNYSNLGFSGYFAPKGGKLTSLSYRDSYSEVKGDARLSYDFSGKVQVSLDGKLSSDQESYTLNLGYDDGDISGSAEVQRAPIGRFMKSGFSGFFSASVKARGTLSKPELSFSLTTQGAEFQSNTLALSLSGALKDNLLSVSNASLSSIMVSAPQISGTYKLDSGESHLSARVEMPMGEQVSSARIEASGQAYAGKASAYAVTGKFLDMKIGTNAVAEWPFTLNVASSLSSFLFLGGKGQEVTLRYRDGGDFNLLASAPLPITGSVSGNVKDNIIQAEVPDIKIDFPIIWSLFGNNMLKVLSGTITGSLHIGGNLADPVYNGTARATNFSATLPAFITDVFGPVTKEFTIENNLMSVRDLRVSSKKSAARLDLGILFAQWFPSVITVKANTEVGKPVTAHTVLNGFAIDGKADCDVDVSISLRELNLKGYFNVSDMNVAPVQTAPGAHGDWPYKIDVRVGVGRKVNLSIGSNVLKVDKANFFNTSADLLNATLEPGSQLAFKYDGDTDDFSLKGNAKIRSGSIFWGNRRFFINEGLVRLNESNERIDPVIDLRASLHERDDLGPVTISLIAENARLSNFHPRFESSPARSESEINALVNNALFGYDKTASSLGGAASASKLVGSISDVFELDYMQKVENWTRDALHLDLLSLKAPILQNFILGEASTGFSNPLDTAGGLGKYLDNTTLVVGKYIGPDLFFQAMIQAQSTSESNLGNLTIYKEFSLEWNAPYFNLTWTVAPEHYKDLFVDDQKLGLTWSFTY
jgi:hypothetical protein